MNRKLKEVGKKKKKNSSEKFERLYRMKIFPFENNKFIFVAFDET